MIALRLKHSVLVSAWALGACVPTQQDVGEPGENDGRCDDAPAVILSVDEVSALGFSAADVLAVAEGPHQSPIHWKNHYEDGGVELEVGPETGEGRLDVTVTYQDAEVRYIEAVIGEQEDFAPESCPARLEIDVDVTIRTEGGALDESFGATLNALSRDVATFQHTLDPDDMHGTLSVESVGEDSDWEIEPPALMVGISSYGLFGSIEGQLHKETSEVAVAGFVTYATFPSAQSRCEIPWEIPVANDHPDVAAVVAESLSLVEHPWSLQLRWEGGASSGLTLAAHADEAELCLRADESSKQFRFGANLDLATDDDLVDATIAVDLDARFEDEVLSHVSVTTPFGSWVAAEDFEAEIGRFGVDVSGYDSAGVDFQGAFAPSEEPGSADGFITIFGVTNPDCSDEPGTGCPGVDTEDLARGEWGNFSN